ncbi:MAG: exo-alpha-sialidase [Clostridia bacterium]|nr:exo-alpha-sialidase [Clostridia bacterium]
MTKAKTWTDLEIICDDKSGKILYCPPVYGICDDKLYMFVNQMVAPDHIHSLDLYVLNEKTDKFEFLWSKPVPFKLNTNVVSLPNRKLLLPGRIGELDGFPNTPAALISDSGKIDADWHLVKIAENGDLPNGKELIHPEISVICAENVLYMFCRNDKAHVPLVYISKDYGETWSDICSHDIPIISSKLYCGDLSDGRHYLVCNTDKINRTKVSLYLTDDNSKNFTKQIVLFDTDKDFHSGCHYPAACEYDNHLYIIATQNYAGGNRGALLFKIDLSEI